MAAAIISVALLLAPTKVENVIQGRINKGLKIDLKTSIDGVVEEINVQNARPVKAGEKIITLTNDDVKREIEEETRKLEGYHLSANYLLLFERNVLLLAEADLELLNVDEKFQLSSGIEDPNIKNFYVNRYIQYVELVKYILNQLGDGKFAEAKEMSKTSYYVRSIDTTMYEIRSNIIRSDNTIKKNKKELDDLCLVAPKDGVVFYNHNIALGQFINARTIVCRVENNIKEEETITIQAYVKYSDAVLIKEGQELQLTIVDSNKKVSGVVSYKAELSESVAGDSKNEERILIEIKIKNDSTILSYNQNISVTLTNKKVRLINRLLK